MEHIPSANARLNLMHVVYGLGTGGLEKIAIQVCNRLPADQFAPSICVFESGGAMESRVDTERVELIHVPRYFGNDPTLPLRLARQLRRRRIDILQTHNWSTLIEGILAAKLARVPVVVHDEHSLICQRRRQIVAQRWGYGMAEQVVAVSEAVAGRIADIVGFPRSQILVIPNGVDTSQFQPSNIPKDQGRRQVGLPSSGVLLGMIARFVPFKDHARVIRAVGKLREVNLDVHLALAGSGPLGDDLKRLADKLGIANRVHFLGELSEVEQLLHVLDIFVSNSSHNEGMSLALLEAMACGVPVVATRVAGSPQVLAEGAAGVLIPPRDTKGLVRALWQLMEDPDKRRSLGQTGRKRAADQYSITSMVESYRRLYTRLAARSGRAFCQEPEDETSLQRTSVP